MRREVRHMCLRTCGSANPARSRQTQTMTRGAIGRRANWNDFVINSRERPLSMWRRRLEDAPEGGGGGGDGSGRRSKHGGRCWRWWWRRRRRKRGSIGPRANSRDFNIISRGGPSSKWRRCLIDVLEGVGRRRRSEHGGRRLC